MFQVLEQLSQFQVEQGAEKTFPNAASDSSDEEILFRPSRWFHAKRPAAWETSYWFLSNEPIPEDELKKGDFIEYHSDGKYGRVDISVAENGSIAYKFLNDPKVIHYNNASHGVCFNV